MKFENLEIRTNHKCILFCSNPTSSSGSTSQFVRQEVRAMCSARLQNQQIQQQQQQSTMNFNSDEIPMDLIDQSE